jgi:hypothetical protein
VPDSKDNKEKILANERLPPCEESGRLNRPRLAIRCCLTTLEYGEQSVATGDSMIKRGAGVVFLYPALVAIVLAATGCASNRGVMVGISEGVEVRYGIYPSIEFDTAAVTEDEADQIKKMGVDGYFSPAEPLRKRLNPFTVYFGEENTAPRVLHARNKLWKTWLKKKPSSLVLIANLPHSPDMSPDDDPRLILIDIEKNVFTPGIIYIEIEAEKIVRIYTKPKDPRTDGESGEETASGTDADSS